MRKSKDVDIARHFRRDGVGVIGEIFGWLIDAVLFVKWTIGGYPWHRNQKRFNIGIDLF
jgi:hypothetical protein